MPAEKRNNLEGYNQEYSFNKIAFDDVLGDPFAKPEPIEGHYGSLQKRSSIRVANNQFDMGKATRNTAQPSITDFACDVERIISSFVIPALQQKFRETYITEECDTHFTPAERAKLEQTVGKAFRRNKISPVSKYFTAVRQSIRSNQEGARIANAQRNRLSL